MSNQVYNKILNENKDNNINLLIYSNSDYKLNEVYSSLLDRSNMKKEIKEVIHKSSSIPFTRYYNNHFMEINLEEIQSNRDVVLKDFIKTFTSYSFLEVNKIVIHNIDLLKKKEQFILRKIIETASSCKFILFSKNINNLINPIISRCLSINLRDIDIKDLDNSFKDINIVRDNLVRNFYDIKKTVIEETRKERIDELKVCNKEDDIDLLFNNITTFIKSKTQITNKKVKELSKDLEYLYKKYDLSFNDIIKRIYLDMYQGLPSKKYQSFNKILLNFSSKLNKSSKQISQVMGFIYEMKYEYNNSK